jgi:hypothetical protein
VTPHGILPSLISKGLSEIKYPPGPFGENHHTALIVGENIKVKNKIEDNVSCFSIIFPF